MMSSFFERSYQTPQWLKDKPWFQQRINRRQVLKAAGGATAVVMAPQVLSATAKQAINIQQEPWRTLDAVLSHLLPSSGSGPGAKEINALVYLHQVLTVQPIDEEEKAFIRKGVGWLNGYSQSQLQQDFVVLSDSNRERVLRGIAGSRAGENWLATLISYLFEALLAPPVYGGNPKGIGWQWLEHQPGFPLPDIGTRYYELPGSHSIAVTFIDSTTATAKHASKGNPKS